MRIYSVLAFGVLSAAACSAGSIELGGSSGLTSNYITQGTGAVCAAGTGNCLAGSAGGFTEKNYDNRLFQTATENGTSPTPFNGYVQNSGIPSGSTLGQFAMISDGTGSTGSSNYWDGLSATTITVPVGISDVSDVWTMISNIWGQAGALDTIVTFDFGTSSNSSLFNNVVVVDLQNAGNSSSSASGQTGTAVDCASSCGANTFASGQLASTSLPTTSLNSNPATLAVNTEDLFTTGNAYNTVAAGAFAGTSGTLSLDAQDFLLSSVVAPSSSEYLVQIKVQELFGSTGGINASQTALSAITVDTASTTTPEPSTVLLFLSGIGALGIARFRRQ